MSPKPIDLTALQTEARNPQSAGIDDASTTELCRILNDQDASVSRAVQTQISVIAQVIDVLTERVSRGGRVFYIGAGTSGRLGVLDASELPPTFSAPPGQFIGLIAGGDTALRNAIEGAEDDRSGAAADLAPYGLDPEVDCLIGVAASGRTPYVLGGLAHAKVLGCTTVGLVCVEPSAVREEGAADYVIAPVTGPEVVTGSTRMKAGTATKMVLNMISTGVMIKLGKTYGNLMIDVKATNDKLKVRARNILRTVAGDASKLSDDQLDEILDQCAGSVKLAAVVAKLRAPVEDALERLTKSRGVLSRALEEAALPVNGTAPELVLCVDAGGSGCKAVVMSQDGNKGAGRAGPCNPSTIGVEGAVASISQAVQLAVDSHPDASGRRFQDIHFKSIRIGIAGYSRPALASSIDKSMETLFRTRLNEGLRVTDDVHLLTATAELKPGIQNLIVLLAGTGSIVMAYKRDEKSQFYQSGRVGGWGHLLGDDGSGYAISREAIRKALGFYERQKLRTSAGLESQEPSRLCRVVVQHFQRDNCSETDLLSSVLSSPLSAQEPERGQDLSKTSHIASFAQHVLGLAYDGDAESRKIADVSAAELAEMVILLAETQRIDLSTTGLALTGGLMKNKSFSEDVLGLIRQRCGDLKHVDTISDTAELVASQLSII